MTNHAARDRFDDVGNRRRIYSGDEYRAGAGLHQSRNRLHAQRRRTRCARRNHDLLSNREPAGPYRLTVPARRTLHQRFNELRDPEIPRGADYASVIVSDVPIVVQHTRLDSRQSANALLTTIAYCAT